MAGYGINFGPNNFATPNSPFGSGLNPTGRVGLLSQIPRFQNTTSPNFLQGLQQNIQGGLDSLKESTQGLPQSLYDLVINKKIGFNLGGDKGYLNLRFPKSQGQFNRGESDFGVDFNYNF
jgi:hypothetical protein